MVSVLSSLPQQQQSQQGQYQILHLQRPFIYDDSANYELAMNTYYQDYYQQQECYQQQLQDYEPLSSPETGQKMESPWFSPLSTSCWHQEQQQEHGEHLSSTPPLMYPDHDTEMKYVLWSSASNSSCGPLASNSDGPWATVSPSDEHYPMEKYFACRRDSSASTMSGSSCSENSITSSISSNYAEEKTTTTMKSMTTVKTEPIATFDEPPQSFNTAPTNNTKRLHRRSSTRGKGSGGPHEIIARPHRCEVCTRTFARRHDLERHTRVHTGIKPYVCPCCLKAFPRSDARGRHFRNEPRCRTGPQVLAFIKKKIRNTI